MVSLTPTAWVALAVVAVSLLVLERRYAASSAGADALAAITRHTGSSGKELRAFVRSNRVPARWDAVPGDELLSSSEGGKKVCPTCPSARRRARRALAGRMEPFSSTALAFLARHHLYVSCTTSPARLPHLGHLLTLYDLRGVTAVYVVLPLHYAPTGETYDDRAIARLRTSLPHVVVLRPREDLGPASKIVPTLEHLQRTTQPAVDNFFARDIVVSIDDDTLLRPDGLARLVNASVDPELARANQPYVVATSGEKFRHWHVAPAQAAPRTVGAYLEALDTAASVRALRSAVAAHYGNGAEARLRPVQVIEGYGGVAYRVGAVDTGRVRRLAQIDRSTLLSDDVVLSVALAQAGVATYALSQADTPARRKALLFQLGYGMRADALHSRYSNAAKYPAAVQAIEATEHGDRSASAVRASHP